MFTVGLKPGVAERIVWSRPDSPPPALCSICHGPLPEVPFQLWKGRTALPRRCATPAPTPPSTFEPT